MADQADETKLSRDQEIAELKRQIEQMNKRLEELSSEGASGGAKGEAVASVGSSDAKANPGDGRSVSDGGSQAVCEQAPAKAEDDEPEFDEAYVKAAVEDFMPQSKPPEPAPSLQGQPSAPYAAAYNGQPPVQPYAQQTGQTAYYQNASASQGAYQGQYQQGGFASKDHVAAGLLAIFLGVFGVHKFYLGYNTAGFILLGVTILGGIFTFGIAASVVWLIGLIEGVIYLTKSQAEFNQIYVYGKRDWF